MPSLRGTLPRTRSTPSVTAAAKQYKHRTQPPSKRRRLIYNSSTPTEEDDEDDSLASSTSSGEHDNERDEDYEEEDQLQAERARRKGRRKGARYVRSTSDESVSSVASASTSASSSSCPSPKPLSPIEVNAAPLSRNTRKRSSIAKGKQSARQCRRDILVAAKSPRFAISPLKIPPSQHSNHQHQRRGFHVRPDGPFLPSSVNQHPARENARNALQNGFRRFAGRMMHRVNNIGVSGNGRERTSALASAAVPPPTNSIMRNNSSCGFKRKRNPLIEKEKHRTVPLNDPNHADSQPLRRTRSIARKMEEIGIPMGRVEDKEAASRAENFTLPAGQTESDDEADSVERSIAEMSLDEISEHKDDEESESAADESDDAWYLREANSAQLHRLRKDKLLQLNSTIDVKERQDRSDWTKDLLVKLILDIRYDAATTALHEAVSSSASTSSTSSSDHEKKTTEGSDDRVLTTRRYSPQRLRRPSSASSASTSASVPDHNPDIRGKRTANRSKSFPQVVESSAGDDNDEEDKEDQPSTRSNAVNHRRAASFSLGLARPTTVGERTPGRLRSGKLRNSILGTLDCDIENKGEDDDPPADEEALAEEYDDMPTPIARRTRHHRNISALSVSSAGFGDDEEGDLPNHEYRLRKVSLPRKAKRGSFIESSEDEPEVGDQEDSQTINEEGDRTIEEIETEEVDEEDEDEDALNHDVDYDFSSATLSGLMRLRRDDLLKLCLDSNIHGEGTKKELASRLLEWHSLQQNDDETVDIISPSSTNDEEEYNNEEEDDSFDPAADMSLTSQSSVDEDGEEQLITSSPVKSDFSDVTARQALKYARNETKTQALAKLSNKSQSYDSRSQEKPLLLQNQESLVHSKKVDTPPGSGDQQDNDLELDLESLNLLDKEIAPDKLKKGGKIGSGGFKDVYEGRYRNVKVALADIRGHLTENDLKELGLLRDLRHENIVRFIGVSIPEQKDVPVTIVSELCTNGDLFDYIRNVSPPPFEKILSIMLNVAKGVDYLHQRKPAIVHRDLKSSNVLITSKGIAKVTDFGLARVRNSTRSLIKSLVGTVNWQAPELWVPHPRYNEKADVYSAGLVFWECLQWHLKQKRYPFEGMNEHAIYQDVGSKQSRPPTATMRRQWGGEIVDLVERMWAQDAKARPPMSEVVKDLEGFVQVEKARAKAARNHN